MPPAYDILCVCVCVCRVNFHTCATSALAVDPLRVAHAVLMALSWGVCLPLGVLTAMFLRGVSPTTGHHAFWFVWHKRLQMGGLGMAIIGTILALVMVQGNHLAVTHSKLGVVVMACGIFQPLNAIIRPKPGEKWRWLWGYFHKGTGYGSVVLAAATIYTGLMVLGVPVATAAGKVYVGVFPVMMALSVLWYCRKRILAWAVTANIASKPRASVSVGAGKGTPITDTVVSPLAAASVAPGPASVVKAVGLGQAMLSHGKPASSCPTGASVPLQVQVDATVHSSFSRAAATRRAKTGSGRHGPVATRSSAVSEPESPPSHTELEGKADATPGRLPPLPIAVTTSAPSVRSLKSGVLPGRPPAEAPTIELAHIPSGAGSLSTRRISVTVPMAARVAVAAPAPVNRDSATPTRVPLSSDDEPDSWI